LDSSAEPIAGRTAIQKIAYFESLALRADLKYRPHFYGPYSSVVDETLMDLVASDYVEERARTTIRDRTLYSYALTDDGHQLVEQIKSRHPKTFPKIKTIVEECGNSGNDINVLSWAAKVHFLLTKKGSTMSHEEAINMGRKFNWDLSEPEIDLGVKLLLDLGLASKSD
jgi:uncharacterized protein YwgA